MAIRNWTVCLTIAAIVASAGQQAHGDEQELLIGVTGPFGPKGDDDPLLIRSRYVVVNTALQGALKSGEVQIETTNKSGQFRI